MGRIQLKFVSLFVSLFVSGIRIVGVRQLQVTSEHKTAVITRRVTVIHGIQGHNEEEEEGEGEVEEEDRLRTHLHQPDTVTTLPTTKGSDFNRQGVSVFRISDVLFPPVFFFLSEKL